MLAHKSRSNRAAIEGADGSEEDPKENLFNNRDLVKRLVDGCILPEVVHRIVHTDPEKWVWDSLGSFLEVDQFTFFFFSLLYLAYSLAFVLTPWLLLQIGHQLIANIEAMNNAKKEAAQMEEGR